MIEHGVRLRPATPNDRIFLLRLRNDADVRHQSRSQDEVTEGEHAAWLGATLHDDARRLYVVETDDRPVGQVRLDIDGDAAEISIALIPESRGLGVGRSAIDEASTIATLLGLRRIRAYARETNTPSLVAFARAGFDARGSSDGYVELVRCLSGEG